MMRFSTRELVLFGVFGALWGVVEIGVGSVLHTLGVPMIGLFLGAFGLLVAMVGRFFVPRKGSTLFVGVIAALLKLLSIGGVVIWPMIAIFMEALIAEIFLSILGGLNRWVFILTGALAVFYSFIHPFFCQGLLAGRGMLFVWEMLLSQGTRLFSLPESTGYFIIGLMALTYLVVGALVGVLAWDIAQVIRNRLTSRSELVF